MFRCRRVSASSRPARERSRNLMSHACPNSTGTDRVQCPFRRPGQVWDTGSMRPLTFEQAVARIRSRGDGEPRIVLSGNAATPLMLVDALTHALERCRVFQLNAQHAVVQHPGFICETPFVGPGMRHAKLLDYLPMRLSLVPRLFDTERPPAAVHLNTSL